MASMQIKRIAFFAAFLGATSAAAAGSMLVAGRCHMGECSFTEILVTKTIASREGGSLVAAKERSAVVKAPIKDGEPQYHLVKPPKFLGIVKVIYAFCSTELPTYVFYSDKKFYVHVLNVGDPTGFSGYNIDSHILYWAICHQKIVRADELASPALAKEAREFGYRKVDAAENGQYEFRNWGRVRRFLSL